MSQININKLKATYSFLQTAQNNNSSMRCLVKIMYNNKSCVDCKLA